MDRTLSRYCSFISAHKSSFILHQKNKSYRALRGREAPRPSGRIYSTEVGRISLPLPREAFRRWTESRHLADPLESDTSRSQDEDH